MGQPERDYNKWGSSGLWDRKSPARDVQLDRGAARLGCVGKARSTLRHALAPA
jgi:hypothetical protein